MTRRSKTATKPALTHEARRTANDRMFQNFVACYDPGWRLTKLLALQVILEQRGLLQAKLAEVHLDPEMSGEAYVYGPASNGLIFSAIAETAMACEDFFALINGIREPQYFVRSTVSYSAGSVKNLIKRIHRAKDEAILKALLLPAPAQLELLLESSDQDVNERDAVLERYSRYCALAVKMVREAARAFERFETPYNQYKHGLTVALRPFGNLPGDAHVRELKTKLGGQVVFYDNDRIEDAFSKGNLQGGVAFFMDADSHPYLLELIKERNHLRYANVSFIEIAELVGTVQALSTLSVCLIRNRLALIEAPLSAVNRLFIPDDELVHKGEIIDLEVRLPRGSLGIDDFQGKL